ncbi:MAG: hypothetical protein ACW98X_24435 [Promethearchaeota archaeon]
MSSQVNTVTDLIMSNVAHMNEIRQLFKRVGGRVKLATNPLVNIFFTVAEQLDFKTGKIIVMLDDLISELSHLTSKNIEKILKASDQLLEKNRIFLGVFNMVGSLGTKKTDFQQDPAQVNELDKPVTDELNNIDVNSALFKDKVESFKRRRDVVGR